MIMSLSLLMCSIPEMSHAIMKSEAATTTDINLANLPEENAVGDGFNYDVGRNTITLTETDKKYHIVSDGRECNTRIIVGDEITCDIVLEDVYVQSVTSGKAALELGKNSYTVLTLTGDNTLYGYNDNVERALNGGYGFDNTGGAGILTNQATLEITGDGTLTAKGGMSAAAIGGQMNAPEGANNRRLDGGTLTISGGTVYAIATRSWGEPAAIGGGGFSAGGNYEPCSAGTINITGGVVVAKGSEPVSGKDTEGRGRAIGAGGNGTGGEINITGGIVYASGYGVGGPVWHNKNSYTSTTVGGDAVVFTNFIQAGYQDDGGMVICQTTPEDYQNTSNWLMNDNLKIVTKNTSYYDFDKGELQVPEMITIQNEGTMNFSQGLKNSGTVINHNIMRLATEFSTSNAIDNSGTVLEEESLDTDGKLTGAGNVLEETEDGTTIDLTKVSPKDITVPGTYIVTSNGTQVQKQLGFVSYGDGDEYNIRFRNLNLKYPSYQWGLAIRFYNAVGDLNVNMNVEGENHIFAGQDDPGICVLSTKYAGETQLNFGTEDAGTLNIGNGYSSKSIATDSYSLDLNYPLKTAFLTANLMADTKMESLTVGGESFDSISKGVAKAKSAAPFILKLNKEKKVPTKYNVSFIANSYGTASASNATPEEGEIVSISARPNSGYKFTGWESSNQDVAFENAAKSNTTFEMPAGDVEIAVNFEETVTSELTVIGGTGSGYYEKGEKPIIKATVLEEQIFKEWQMEDGSDAVIASPSNATTTVTMGKQDTVITAVFDYIKDVITCVIDLIIKKEPAKTTYKMTEEFNPAGLVVQAKGKASPSNAEYTYTLSEQGDGYELDSSEFDSTQPGEYEIHVKYTFDNGEDEEQFFDKTFMVEVLDEYPDDEETYVSDIKIKAKPVKQTYYIDDEIDLTGLVVVAKQQGVDSGHGKEDRILTADDYDIEYDFSKVGTRKVTIYYYNGGKNGDKTYRATFTVKVLRRYSSDNDLNDSDSSSSSSTTSSTVSPWSQTSTNIWQYKKSDGIYAADEWVLVTENGNGVWYYFTPDAKMQTGWMTDPKDGHRYYLDPISGRMATGWIMIDGVWHYFNEVSPEESGWFYDTAKKEWAYVDKGRQPLGMWMEGAVKDK